MRLLEIKGLHQQTSTGELKVSIQKDIASTPIDMLERAMQNARPDAKNASRPRRKSFNGNFLKVFELIFIVTKF